MMSALPKSFKHLVVQKHTSNFREAVSVEMKDMCSPREGEVCIKIKFVGINATDINVTKGCYSLGVELNSGVGFEGVGNIVQVGSAVKDLKEGQSVAFITAECNAYAEYLCIPAAEIFNIPEAKPEYLALPVSGLTASLSLDKSARLVAGETVLITAAAGGAGHIAVQWAKAAGCYVIGTCSTKEKEDVLKELGCDRIINYKAEDLAGILAKEHPKGIDVIWETIGGKVFTDLLQNLAVKGRLIVVGGISGYKSETQEIMPKMDLSFLPELLLFRSAAVLGFFMLHYKECFASYFTNLKQNVESGKLKIIYDNGEKSTGKEFFGMEGIISGVEHLHSGKNIGKVIARIF